MKHLNGPSLGLVQLVLGGVFEQFKIVLRERIDEKCDPAEVEDRIFASNLCTDHH
jgi:hypothetical protein